MNLTDGQCCCIFQTVWEVRIIYRTWEGKVSSILGDKKVN